MTVLELIKRFCRRTGLPSPSAAFTSSDDQVQQYIEILNDVLVDLTTNYSWEVAQTEATFESVASASQGAISTLAPYGFIRILDDTIYNRTSGLKTVGPISPSEWQSIQALTSIGINEGYRITSGELFLTPTPAGGDTLAFEYVSSYVILDNDGSTLKQRFSNDNDTILLNDDLIHLGLRYMWKLEKGLPYAVDEANYIIMAKKLESSSGSKPTIDLAGSTQNMKPGIGAPPGSWNL